VGELICFKCRHSIVELNVGLENIKCNLCGSVNQNCLKFAAHPLGVLNP
jgi:LSD1 subclass zinc finger protein